MKIYMAIILSLVSLACHAADARDNKTGSKNKWLVSAEPKERISRAELNKSYRQFSDFIKNGYTAYTIKYQTTNATGATIVASGALFVPDIKEPLPLLNYNHGTYFPSQEKQAPSYLNNNYELMMGKLFSSAGYLVVMPDYIGYGSTKKEKHPYGAYHEIAGSVVDMLSAVKEFCVKNDIVLSGKNFFSGWSEGAAVAVATVKLLEENPLAEFKPTATVVNAGPYYSSGFVHHVLDATQPLVYINSYVWILQSYNQLYSINRPLSYYFNEPAATNLREGPEAYIPRDPRELFTQTFVNNYKAGKDTAFQNALLKNDLWNWKPGSKIVFCHGDKDDYVPVFNSEKAYNSMKEKGADVKLKIFRGHNHSSGVLEFVKEAFTNFERARADD